MREHWGLENRLHWRLDVIMNEDQKPSRLGDGPRSLAILRHRALNAEQKEASKGSLRGKIKLAGRDDADQAQFRNAVDLASKESPALPERLKPTPTVARPGPESDPLHFPTSS